MLSNSHIDLDSGIHCQTKISRACLDRPIDIARCTGLLGVDAAIDVVIVAMRVGEEREVAERRAATSARIMHTGETGNTTAIISEASLVVPGIGVGYGFRHTIWKRRAGEDIPYATRDQSGGFWDSKSDNNTSIGTSNEWIDIL